jgi:hypothetical protein
MGKISIVVTTYFLRIFKGLTLVFGRKTGVLEKYLQSYSPWYTLPLEFNTHRIRTCEKLESRKAVLVSGQRARLSCSRDFFRAAEQGKSLSELDILWDRSSKKHTAWVLRRGNIVSGQPMKLDY